MIWFIAACVLFLSVSKRLAARGVVVSPIVKRFTVAILLAVGASSSAYAVVCVACENCDPWWLIWFWICVAP